MTARSLPPGFRTPRYRSDAVRALFLTAAAGMLVTIPLAPDVFPLGTVPIVGGALVLLLFASLTHPTKRSVLIGDAILAGAGMLSAEVFAVNRFEIAGIALLGVREAFALAFAVALYLSVKTVRARAGEDVPAAG